MNTLLSRYEHANAHPTTLLYMQQAICKIQSSRGGGDGASNPVQDQPLCAFVFNFHPVFRQVLNLALSHCKPPPHLGMKIVLAWKNALPCVSALATRANRVACMRYIGIGSSREGLLSCSQRGRANLNSISYNMFAFVVHSLLH